MRLSSYPDRNSTFSKSSTYVLPGSLGFGYSAFPRGSWPLGSVRVVASKTAEIDTIFSLRIQTSWFYGLNHWTTLFLKQVGILAFLYRETEAQKGYEVFQKPHTRPVEELRTEPTFPDTSTNDSATALCEGRTGRSKEIKIQFLLKVKTHLASGGVFHYAQTITTSL